jgi:hypothetical protein
MLEGAAVREDVAQDAVLGVVDLSGGERDRAVRCGKRARGRDDAAASVVGEVDAAGVIVHAGELAAGEGTLAVVMMADLADLRALGAVAALVQHAAEWIKGPGDARAGGGDSLGDAARPVEALAQRAGVGRVDPGQAAGAVARERGLVAGGIDRGGEAARGVVRVARG